VQQIKHIRHNSRKLKPASPLAVERKVLTDFANIREEKVEKFRAEHPDFFLAGNLTEEGWQNGFLLRLGGAGKTIFSGRALHLAEALSKDLPNVTLRMRDIVRRIWSGDPFANDYLKALLYGTRVEFDWKRGEITYEPQNEFERALYALFRNSSLAKICANAECTAPYFIARRTTQRYCSLDCAEVFQQKWKLDWWKRVGSKKRSEQRAKKKGKRER
jgi:hypothetical protein